MNQICRKSDSALYDSARSREIKSVEELNNRRIAKNLSYRELAKASGISHSTVNDIFRGKRIKLWQMYVFADVLGVPLGDVVQISEGEDGCFG